MCPIPEFSASDPNHVRLIEVASVARSTIEKWGPTMEGGLAKIREAARQLITAELSQIDSVVAKMFGDSISTNEPRERDKAGQVHMFD